MEGSTQEALSCCSGLYGTAGHSMAVQRDLECARSDHRVPGAKMKGMEAQLMYSLGLPVKGKGEGGADAPCRSPWCCVADVSGRVWFFMTTKTYLRNKECWSETRSICQKWGSSIFTNRLTNLVRTTLTKKHRKMEFKDQSGEQRQGGQWNTI